MSLNFNLYLLKSVIKRRIEELRGKLSETFGVTVLDVVHCRNRIFMSIPGTEFTSFKFTGRERIHLHTSAAGKVTLAFMPERDRNKIISRLKFERLTPATITNERNYRRCLDKVARLGYATDLGEEVEGCRCAAVPIRKADGTAGAVLFISGIAAHLPDSVLKRAIATLRGTAGKIESDFAAVHAIEMSTKKPSPFTRDVINKLRENLARPFAFETLADAKRISYSTLRSTFKAETGLTIGQYLQRLRLEEACRLLEETKLPLQRISEQTGFCNEKYLSFLFRRSFGMPPGNYRRSMAANTEE